MAMNLDAVLRISTQVKGANALQDLGLKLQGVSKAAGGAVSPFGQMSGAMRGLADVAATIGLAAIGRDLLNAGLDAQATTVRINALAGPLGETNGLMEIAAKAADQFALGNVEAQKSVTDLYARLRPMGVSLKDIETVFFGVNKAAKLMGLSTYDTSEVLLQLSQALGSGKLQGDELRSIMERMPAVGQAVAKVMGVSASEIKKLGSEGKITTEVMIKAAAELNKIKPPPPTAMQEFDKALKDLRTEIGENLLPVLTPLVQGVTGLVRAFSALPEPIQTAVVALGALAIAAGPIASVIAGIGKAMVVIGGLGPVLAGIGATIAGWAGIVGPALAAIGSALGSLGGIIAGVFTGPVGWVALLAAAAVALYAFRDQIGAFFSWVWQIATQSLSQLWGWIAQQFSGAAQFFQPLLQAWQAVWGQLSQIAQSALQAVAGIVSWFAQAAIAILWQVFVQPWINIWNGFLRQPVMAFVSWIGGIWANISSAFVANVIQPIQRLWNDLMGWFRSRAADISTTFQSAWRGISTWFQSNVLTPIQRGWEAVMTAIPRAINQAGTAIRSFWTGIINNLRSIINGFLRAVVNAFNSVANLVNRAISAFNALPGPDIPRVPLVTAPAFAEGGFVDRPTLAQVAEAGEGEYIIPESKMARAAANYLGGARGAAVIPTNGGTVTAAGASPVINITTGPVLEFDGRRYVTLSDFERGMRATAEGVLGRLRTPAARVALRGAG